MCHLPAVAEEKDIPYCYTPSRADLGSAMGVKRGTLTLLIREHEDYKELFDEITSETKIPSLNTERGGYIVTQILSVGHIKSSTYSDMISYFRDVDPDAPRRRCICDDVEDRQRSAVMNRLFLVKRIKKIEESIESLEGLLSESFIEYEVNPTLKGKKGLKNYIKFTQKDTARLIDFGIVASNKVSNNLKIYLAEKNRCEQKPGCDLTILNTLQKDCHATLDHLEDIDGKFLRFCDIIHFFIKFCGPIDDKPIEETSHWTPIFARFWGTLVIYLMHLLPGYALCRMKSFATKPMELEGFYVEEGYKKYRFELVQKWEKYREFLGTIATDLKESREVVTRLACKYLMKHFRGEDAKRPHCILDQFILLMDQLRVMRNYFKDVLEIADVCLFYAHQSLSSLWYNPIFEVYFTNIAEFFPYCMPNFFSAIISLYGSYISELDIGSADCLLCHTECIGLVRYACQECLGDSIFGTYCSRMCRGKDEADHMKICSLRAEDTLKKYKNIFVPMNGKPLKIMNWLDERREGKQIVILKKSEDRVEYTYMDKKKVEAPPPKSIVPSIPPLAIKNNQVCIPSLGIKSNHQAIQTRSNAYLNQGTSQTKSPRRLFTERKTQRMQERMAKKRERRTVVENASDEALKQCQEVERRHLKTLQQRPDLR
ncbi:NHP2 [Lepeophtheirus salmonis]|uniref:NHP2 n=1 Tax=Lepeophtheirus salmonis TaxID=72036 RepID=A0A7R8CFL9_LEPSM|nr:NHP2 [Lepeophtheirus salmonis]CAF2807937.1 NHP2 [Lepeophtheirus salmonis]